MCLLLFVYDSMGHLPPSQGSERQVMAEATIVNYQPVSGTGEVLRQHLFLDLFFFCPSLSGPGWWAGSRTLAEQQMGKL